MLEDYHLVRKNQAKQPNKNKKAALLMVSLPQDGWSFLESHSNPMVMAQTMNQGTKAKRMTFAVE